MVYFLNVRPSCPPRASHLEQAFGFRVSGLGILKRSKHRKHKLLKPKTPSPKPRRWCDKVRVHLWPDVCKGFPLQLDGLRGLLAGRGLEGFMGLIELRVCKTRV